MRTRYALAALGLFCAPAIVQAQNVDTEFLITDGDTLGLVELAEFPNTYVNPALTVNTPSSLARTFFDGMDEEGAFPSPYTPPLAPANGQAVLIGGSVMRCIVETEESTTCLPLTPAPSPVGSYRHYDLAPPFFEGGDVTDPITDRTYTGSITANVVVADPIIGCASEGGAVINRPVALNNADEVAGNIVMMARGACGFSVKATTAQRAGAIGYILYIPPTTPYTPYQRATLMAATTGGAEDGTDGDLLFATDSLGLAIPGVLIPFGIAEPILDEIDFGGEVNVTIAPAPVNALLDLDNDGFTDTVDILDGGVEGPLADYFDDYYNRGETYGALVDFLPIRGTLKPADGSNLLNPLGARSVDVAETVEFDADVTTMKAFPNPFATTATVALQTALPEKVRVEVYNTLGQRVAVLHEGLVSERLNLELDASQLAVGLYLVRATGESFVQTTRVTVAR